MARQGAKPSTQIKYYPFNGGLDVVTPALSVDPGFALALVNYEPWYNGGYRRVDGYERFDGRAKPSAATVYGAVVSSLTGISLGTSTGSVGTGSVSGATAQFVQGIAVGGTSYLALTNITGTFGTGDKIIIGTNTSTGTLQTAPSLSFAPAGTSTTGYQYVSDFVASAQNYYRQQIGTVPGTGKVLGVWQNGTNIYAVRGTGTAGTPAKLYLSSGTGWTTSGVTYTTTIYYNTLTIGKANLTASVNTNGVMTVTVVNSGTPTVGMYMSDANGFLPAGVRIKAQLTGSAGSTGDYQLDMSPTMTVPSETINGINPTSSMPAVGATINGQTSGATGVVYAVISHDTAIGYIAMTGVTGTFQNAENLRVGATAFAVSDSVATPFTLPSTGFYRWRNFNFFATSATYYTYGVNGQGSAFQIDQSNVVLPILFPRTPITNQPSTNNPFLLEIYANSLFLGLPGGIYQSSVPGQPTQFNGFLGANQFSTGAELTGMYSIAGPALALLTSRNTQVLNGNSAATFVQSIAGEKSGAILNAGQALDTVYALNNLGITSLSRTQSFGNFVGATVSQLVQPIVNTLRASFVDSTVVRLSNQARFYFSDGSVLIMYVPGLGQQNKAWSAVQSGVTAQFGYANYPAPIYNICNTEDANNAEQSYFSSSNADGYVYQDRSGTSWDGVAITSYVRLVFNNVGTPAVRKYYRRADLELNALSPLALKFTADLSYSADSPSSAVTQLTANDITAINIFGGGGYWNSINWNQFDWDAQTVSSARAALAGTGENISFLIFHQAIVDSPFILQGIVLHYDPRRLQR